MKIKPIHYQTLVKVFEIAGCTYSRTRGDHLVFHYPGAIRPVVIPMYKEVPAFVIKNNMRIIGMSREDYFDILAQV